MKKIISAVLLLLLFTAPGFAQGGYSTLRVSLSDHSHLSVALNGRYFGKHGTSLTIGDLPAGRHYLKVYTYEQDDRGRGHAHLVYSGAIRIHRGTYAECIIDPNTGDIQMNENGDNRQYSYDRQERNGTYDDRTYNETVPPGDDVYENGNKYKEADAQAADNAIGSFGTGPMSKGDMDGIKSMIRGKSNDADKRQAMETELKGKSFTTDQVVKLMGWLDSDDNRLQLAEWAYPEITDKGNYKQLGSAFSDGKYLKELDDYIASRK
jgi:hypothetical protein